MIANAGKVYHTTTAHQNDAMFLQVMAFTADICCHFIPVHETDTGYFSQS